MLLGSSWPPKTTLLTQFLNGWNFLSKFRPKKTEKVPRKKNRKKPNTTANFKFGTGFFRFFQLQPPPHWPSHGHHLLPLALTKPLFSPNLPLNKALIPPKSPHNFAKSPFSPNWPSHIPNLLILQKPQFTINSPYSLY